MANEDYNIKRKLPAVSGNYQGRNPTVDNVERAYRRIRTQGDYLQAWADAIPGLRYTANHQNKLGLGNHLQGMQRLRRGQYFVISGGDPHKGEGFGPGSHVFVVKMGSRGATGPWGSNITTESRPHANPKRDKIARIIGIDRTLWHAGGMAVLGDVLAVPVETSSPRGKSKVVFFNMANPEKPQRFAHEVVRSRGKAGAVAMTRLENDYYLLAVWSDSDTNPKKPRRLDFYLSRSTKFGDGFHQTPVTWRASSVRAAPGQDKNFSNFQTVNFINQRDGRLFLIGLHNTSEAAPTKPGRDYADLFSVSLPASLTRATPALAKPTITKLAKRQFFCNDQQANMDAAAGTYITPTGGLNVYAAWHWRSDDLMRFIEFREELTGRAPEITSTSDAWIDLYEHDGYKGRRLSIIGRRPASIPHFGNISVQGSAFEDKISSVRFQLPKGVDYALYRHRRFEGEALVLHGTGFVEEIKNLHRDYGIGDKVSSARYE